MSFIHRRPVQLMWSQNLVEALFERRRGFQRRAAPQAIGCLVMLALATSAGASIVIVGVAAGVSWGLAVSAYRFILSTLV